MLKVNGFLTSQIGYDLGDPQAGAHSELPARVCAGRCAVRRDAPHAGDGAGDAGAVRRRLLLR